MLESEVHTVIFSKDSSIGVTVEYLKVIFPIYMCMHGLDGIRRRGVRLVVKQGHVYYSIKKFRLVCILLLNTNVLSHIFLLPVLLLLI